MAGQKIFYHINKEQQKKNKERKMFLTFAVKSLHLQAWISPSPALNIWICENIIWSNFQQGYMW